MTFSWNRLNSSEGFQSTITVDFIDTEKQYKIKEKASGGKQSTALKSIETRVSIYLFVLCRLAWDYNRMLSLCLSIRRYTLGALLTELRMKQTTTHAPPPIT